MTKPEVVSGHTALTDSTLTTPEMRKKDIEAAVARIFEGGVVPDSVIIFADLGPDSGQIRVSCCGKTAELVPLAIAGNDQLAALLGAAFNQQIKGVKLNG